MFKRILVLAVLLGTTAERLQSGTYVSGTPRAGVAPAAVGNFTSFNAAKNYISNLDGRYQVMSRVTTIGNRQVTRWYLYPVR